MPDATAPPFDPVDLEPALRPFGQSRMLPRDAYTSPRVFAFEQERFFAGSWTAFGAGGAFGAGSPSHLGISPSPRAVGFWA